MSRYIDGFANQPAKEKLITIWERWAAYGLAALFMMAGSYLMISKHNAFETRTYDFARFAQAIWNIPNGRFLYTSISDNNILGNHFSPLLALYTPLLLIWPDERILLIAQIGVVAITGLVLSRIVADKHPRLAPLFLLAFYLNPYVHEVSLFEFRRIVPAMPFIALAAYTIYKKRYGLTFFALLAVLMGKEDMGLVVSAFGVYITFFKRQWKWGVPLLLGGIGWTIVASLWIIPAIGRPGNDAKLYPQLFYFDYLGSTYEEIFATLKSDPLILIRHAFQWERLAALGRFFLPLGIVLPFLSPIFALMITPVLSYLLISNDPDMYLLEKWYTAPLLPILFAAIGLGMARLSAKKARWIVLFLLGTTLIGFFISSPAPAGGRYNPDLYNVTTHDQSVAALITAVNNEIPSDAKIAAQVRILPHLALREHIYHYPWTAAVPIEEIDYFVLDRTTFSHPYTIPEINQIITDLIADPVNVVRLEGDEIYLIEPNSKPEPAFAVNQIAEEAMKLEQFDLAVKDANGLYRPVTDTPLHLQTGDEIRVNLYWQALQSPNAERTISLRIAQNGGLIAQYDGWPVQGNRPTSWWQSDWSLRDTYYLTVSDEAANGEASLDILLYDSYTQERIPFDNGDEILSLHQIIID